MKKRDFWVSLGGTLNTWITLYLLLFVCIACESNTGSSSTTKNDEMGAIRMTDTTPMGMDEMRAEVEGEDMRAGVATQESDNMTQGSTQMTNDSHSSNDQGEMDVSTNDYSGLKINEVVSSGSPDWVEFFNLGDTSIDIKDCFISDDLTLYEKARISGDITTIIPAGGFLVIDISDETVGFKIGNNESVYISTPTGEMIDSVSLQDGDSPENGSFGRLPDGTGEFQTLYVQTPSAENQLGTVPACNDVSCTESVECGDGICVENERCDVDCVSMIPIVINEIVAKAPEAGADWVELLNTGSTSIELSGFQIMDNATPPNRYILQDLVINEGEYLVVEITDESVGFKLGAEDGFYLHTDTGALIDGVSWNNGDSPEGKSYGRSPNGTGNFMTLDSPTRGRMNP